MAYLNITPMMDMMTILLVFLLKQFSVQAASMSMSEGLQLPTSSIEAQRPLAVNVTITQNAILVEGDGVTTVRAGAVDPSVKRDGANGYYITPLVDVLTKHANRLKKIAAMGGTPVRRHGDGHGRQDHAVPPSDRGPLLGRPGRVQELPPGRHPQRPVSSHPLIYGPPL